MSKIPKWARVDDCSDEDLSKILCPNGSFTCGLMIALKKDIRCNSCKKQSGTATIVSAKVIKNVDDFREAITKKPKPPTKDN